MDIIQTQEGLDNIYARHWANRFSEDAQRTNEKHDEDEVRQALNCIPADSYGDWITVGMGLKDGGCPFEMFDKWSSSSDKYDQEGTAAKWHSFKSRGITMGSVFYLAEMHGFKFKNQTAKSKKNMTQTIIQLVSSECELWHDLTGQGYATALTKTGHENYLLRSQDFEDHVTERIYNKTQQAPSKQQLESSLRILQVQARSGRKQKAYVRIAWHDTKVYVDLCDEQRTVIEIDSGGWRVAVDPPVKFIRKSAMAELPRPQNGGILKSYFDELNIADADTCKLVMSFTIGALMPGGPYPTLILNGEQGSGKSTIAKAIKNLIDPCNAAALRPTPRAEADLNLWASNSWLLVIDNVSSLPKNISDALCRISTGGGTSARELYTNGREYFFDTQRPVLLNGIEDFATRGDLIDRSIITQMKQIGKAHRRTERSVLDKLEALRPRALGALYDAVSAALKNRDAVSLPGTPRMADFAQFVTAAEPALGWTTHSFVNAFERNRTEAFAIGLESSHTYSVLCQSLNGQRFSGTASSLLNLLSQTRRGMDNRDGYLPKTATLLSGELRRLAPSMRACGWTIEFIKSKERMIAIEPPNEFELESPYTDDDQAPPGRVVNFMSLVTPRHALG